LKIMGWVGGKDSTNLKTRGTKRNKRLGKLGRNSMQANNPGVVFFFCVLLASRRTKTEKKRKRNVGKTVGQQKGTKKRNP